MAQLDYFLTAGHGGKDPGAVANGLKEKDVNLVMMLECHRELKRHGLKGMLSREVDENDPVSEEVQEANMSNTKIAVSFHNNAGGGDGAEFFHHKTSEDGKVLACLCEKYVKQIGQNSRGLKTKSLMFTRQTTMPAVLVEGAFLDNKEDVKVIDTVPEQKAFGVAIAKAILEYFKIPYIPEVKTLYKVQVGAYTKKANAEKLALELEEKGYHTFIVTS